MFGPPPAAVPPAISSRLSCRATSPAYGSPSRPTPWALCSPAVCSETGCCGRQAYPSWCSTEYWTATSSSQRFTSVRFPIVWIARSRLAIASSSSTTSVGSGHFKCHAGGMMCSMLSPAGHFSALRSVRPQLLIDPFEHHTESTAGHCPPDKELSNALRQFASVRGGRPAKSNQSNSGVTSITQEAAVRRRAGVRRAR